MNREVNNEFGLPPAVEAKEENLTATERIAQLRAQAEAQAEQEFDEGAVFAKLLADARSKRMARLFPENDAVLPTDTQGFPEDYDKVVFARGQLKQDLNYVPLSIGGFCIKVPRGIEVILPHAFLSDCADQAVMDVAEPALDARGNLAGITLRPVERFPYSFKGKATKEEYQAFQRAQKEQAQRQISQAA